MRWRRIALWSCLGLLTLIVVAVSWLLLADLGTHKHHIERWASEATGRDIAIDGALHINLGAHSSIIAEDVSISNVEWADQPEMISVGRAEVQFGFVSLLNGPIVIELIDIDDARIFLAKPAEGDPNWVMGKPSVDPKPESTEKKKGILFRQVYIDNVTLVYDAPERTRPVDLFIEQLSQKHRDDDFLQLSVAGTLNDRVIKLDGEVGTWTGLLSQKDVEFDLGARLNNFTLNADGYLDDLIRPRRPRINFTATAPDINELLKALDVEPEGDGDIDLVGSLLPQEQGPLVLDVAGAVGRLDIEATGEISDLQDLQDIDFKLLASGEDVRPILEAIGISQTRSSPFMINVDASRHGEIFTIEKADMVFGQARFGLSARLPEFPRVDEGVLKLQIDGPDIERFRDVFNLPGAATGPFSAGLTIDVADDGLELLNLDLQTSLARVHADGKIGDAPDFYNSSLNFELHSDSLLDIGTAYGVKRLPDAPIEIRGSADYGPDGVRSSDPLSVILNEIEIEVDGLIKPVRGLLGSDFEFRASGASLADLIGAFAANKGVPVQPYSLDGQLQIRDDGYRFREVAGKVGTSDVEVDGLLVPRRRIVGSRFNFAARGAAFTEIMEHLGDFQVTPGPYDLSGSVSFQPDVLGFEDLVLTRATGSIDVDFELGMPVSRRWANLDLRASGPNVQALLKTVDNFEADESPFMIDIEGTLRDTTWSIEKMDIGVGLAKLTGNGTLDLKGETSATLFDLDINIPNVADLGTLNGHRMRQQSFTLNANLTGSDREEIRVENLHATLGPSDIEGDILYRLGEVPTLAIQIQSDSVVVAPLIEKSVEYDPAPEFDDNRLIPDIKIPFEAMARLNSSVTVDIGELQRDSLHIRDLVLRASIQDGALELSEAGFHAASGAITARGSLDPNAGEGAAGFELVARNFAMGMSELNQDVSMTGDIDIKLDSTGTDLRALLGNATGVFFLNARGGRMLNNRFLQALYGSLLDEIVGTINPFAKTEEYTDFECVIMPVLLDDGMVTSEPNSLVATDKMQMVAKSEVNLKNESLDINIRTTPKKGISFSAGEIINPYVKIVGTLAKPKLAVDETGVLLSGGAAVATGGLSVLARAAWTRLSRAKDPCEELARESKELLSDRLPDLSVEIVEPATEPQPDLTEQATQ
ncbi:MAG: AsmA family protein [Woeseiaceae bacterium]